MKINKKYAPGVRGCMFTCLNNAIKIMDDKIKKLIQKYEDYSMKNGFKLNPEKKIVDELIKGLIMNEKKFGEKYCPCRIKTGIQEEDKKIICPCVYHKKEIKEQGHCHCFLFVK